MLSLASMAQRVYPYSDVDIEDYDIEAQPKNSLQRYNAILKLITTLEKGRLNDAPFNINKMPENYIDYIKEALEFALVNKKWKQLQLIKNHEFDYYFHHRSRPEGVILANEILNDTLTLKNSFKIQLYSYLNTVYQELELNTEFIELIPKMYALKKEMNLSDYTLADQEADVTKSYYLNRQYESAIHYSYKALAIEKKQNRMLFKANMQLIIGQSFGKLNKIDSAIIHYDDAMMLLKNIVTDYEKQDEDYKIYLINVIATNKASLLYADQAPEKVIPFALKEFHSFPNNLDPIYSVKIFNLLGKLYYATGDYYQATSYLLMVEENLKPEVYAREHLDYMKIKAQIYLAKGDKKSSIALFKKYERFEDSIAKVKNDTRLAIALAAYDTKQREMELKDQKLLLSQQENTLKQQEQKQLMYLVIIGAFLLLTVLGYFYVKNLNTQKKKIILQKQAIDKSLKQKELLLKEVHHRVKNNLQIVSSLLEGQAGKTDDIAIKAIMIEGQERIDAMALIHQQLYQSEDFKNINLNTYVANLFNHLYTSYNKEGTHVDHVLNVADLQVHIDVAVPFGIVLNELISNCYKYAFKGKSEGRIKISIKPVNDTFNKLTVEDNGVGLPEDFETKKQYTLGIKLIEGISWQLRGKLSYKSSKKGSIFEIIFIKNFETIPTPNEI